MRDTEYKPGVYQSEIKNDAEFERLLAAINMDVRAVDVPAYVRMSPTFYRKMVLLSRGYHEYMSRSHQLPAYFGNVPITQDLPNDHPTGFEVVEMALVE